MLDPFVIPNSPPACSTNFSLAAVKISTKRKDKKYIEDIFNADRLIEEDIFNTDRLVERFPSLSLAGEVKPKIFDPTVIRKPPPVIAIASRSTNFSHETTSKSSERTDNKPIEVIFNTERFVISSFLLQRCTKDSLPFVDAAIKQILEQYPRLEHHYWYDVPLEASRDLVPGVIHSPLIFDVCCSDCIFSDQPCSGFQEDHAEKKCESCRRQGLRCIFRTAKQEFLPKWHYDDLRTREILIRAKERIF
jgi:hypothetical protein